MKVYHPQGSNMTLMITPGVDDPVCSDWKDDKGNAKRFDVRFVNGVAEVPANLGAWMVAKGHANRTALVQMKNKLFRA
jgi:hypothetical protein